jgi:hypothetical protein
MTSQSTTRAPSASADWMDLDNEHAGRARLDESRIAPDRAIQLMKLRRNQMEHRLEELRVNRRIPRVALYARSVNGQDPDRSFAVAREFTERMEWQVGRDQSFADLLSLTAPVDRDGWLRVKQRIKGGFVDGVVAMTRADVSPQLDGYEAELSSVALHGGFVALVHAENVVPR